MCVPWAWLEECKLGEMLERVEVCQGEKCAGAVIGCGSDVLKITVMLRCGGMRRHHLYLGRILRNLGLSLKK